MPPTRLLLALLATLVVAGCAAGCARPSEPSAGEPSAGEPSPTERRETRPRHRALRPLADFLFTDPTAPVLFSFDVPGPRPRVLAPLNFIPHVPNRPSLARLVASERTKALDAAAEALSDRPTVPLADMDSLAAALGTAPSLWSVVDTLDFDGDGRTDRVLTAAEARGVYGVLFIRQDDAYERAGDLEFGHDLAVCYTGDRTAVIRSVTVVGVRFDVYAADLRLARGALTEVWSESFAVKTTENDLPRSPADRARHVRRALALRARTLGPPPGCAFRCGLGGCCTRGTCPPDPGPGWE